MNEGASVAWALRCPFCHVAIGDTSWCQLAFQLPEGDIVIGGAGFAAFRCRCCGGVSESRRSREGRIFLVKPPRGGPNRYARAPGRHRR